MNQIKNRCPHCGSITDKRKIMIYKELINSLWQIYRWCKSKNIHEFKTSEVKHLMGKNEYARFGDLVMFGGIVYKNSKAHYGINMDRCEKFFNNEYKIPTEVWKDPISGEITPGEYKNSKDIPGLISLLNENLEYITNYKA